MKAESTSETSVYVCKPTQGNKQEDSHFYWRHDRHSNQCLRGLWQRLDYVWRGCLVVNSPVFKHRHLPSDRALDTQVTHRSLAHTNTHLSASEDTRTKSEKWWQFRSKLCRFVYWLFCYLTMRFNMTVYAVSNHKFECEWWTGMAVEGTVRDVF